MDAADGSVNDSVMIALLPVSTDWSKVDLPHLTLVYAGKKNDLKPTDFSNLAKDASSLALLSSPQYLTVAATEQFGPPGEQVTAFRFQPTVELWAMRRFIDKWNKSEFPFNPHTTIGPAMTGPLDFVPRVICFDRVYLGWGEDNLTFSMTRGSRGMDY